MALQLRRSLLPTGTAQSRLILEWTPLSRVSTSAVATRVSTLYEMIMTIHDASKGPRCFEPRTLILKRHNRGPIEFSFSLFFLACFVFHTRSIFCLSFFVALDRPSLFISFLSFLVLERSERHDNYMNICRFGSNTHEKKTKDLGSCRLSRYQDGVGSFLFLMVKGGYIRARKRRSPSWCHGD